MNIVFIHGVNDQKTGYSNWLFDNSKIFYKQYLLKNGLSLQQTQEKAAKLIQNEILWADCTTDLVNRYIDLQYDLYEKRKGLWNFMTRKIDPLAVQANGHWSLIRRQVNRIKCSQKGSG